jgi:hypothetical protein
MQLRRIELIAPNYLDLSVTIYFHLPIITTFASHSSSPITRTSSSTDRARGESRMGRDQHAVIERCSNSDCGRGTVTI